MKLLFDQNLSFKLCALLADLFPGSNPPKVIWLRCGNQPVVFVETLLRRHAKSIAEFEGNVTAACLEIH